MIDRTQPLPAPAGYKWHIRAFEPWLFLQLWKSEVAIPEDGLGQLTHCELEVPFDKETQIRRTSKRALRALRDKLSYDELTRRVVGPR